MIHKDKPRVLVVEDELPLRVLATLVLARLGYAPTGVANVERALERIGRGEVDVVLTDLMLPGRNGLDLLQALGAAGGPPALAMTASDDERLIGNALALGARTVLRKPISDGLLDSAVRAALAGTGPAGASTAAA